MRKIVIVNAHWSNRGDEAALCPIINKLLENKNNKIVVIFKDKKEVQDFPYENIKHFSTHFLPKDINVILDCIHGESNCEIEEGLRGTIDEVRQSDLIIYSPGGAVISSKFWWIKQLEYLTPFVCAEEFKIPIVVAAPSMGPFHQEQEKNKILKKYLNSSQKLIVRENISRDYLNEIGVKSEVTIDTAFFDTIRECDVFQKDERLNAFFRKHNKVVAMTLSDFSWNVPLKEKKDKLEKNEETIRIFIENLTKQGYGILLIPQLFGNQDDIIYLMRYSGDDILVLSDRYDTYVQQYVVSMCFALIGMRYHSNIFAAKAAVPFIAIGYEDKMFGFMQQWQLKEYLLYVDQLSIEALNEKWCQLVDNYDQYKDKLRNFRKVWREKAKVTIDTIMNCEEGEENDRKRNEMECVCRN